MSDDAEQVVEFELMALCMLFG
eukprot:COSAG01_NODE_53659_length_337_cov_1.298319_1_plen_21_part_01